MNHDVSFAAVWKFVQAGISYQTVKNAILETATAQEGTDNAILIYHDNFYKSIPTMQVMVAATPTIGIWYPRLTLALVKQWLTMDSFGEDVHLDKALPMIQFGNTLTLPKGFTVNCDYTFQGKGDSRVYQMLKSTNTLDASVRKSFLKNALAVEVFANNILDDESTDIRIYSKAHSLRQCSNRSMRTYGITIRYNFNTTQSKYKGTGAGAQQKRRM